MPVAGGRPNNTKKFDLKSCPGGYIVLRKMDYGDKMLRKQKLGKATVSGNNSKNSNDFVAEMQMINEEVTMFEFARSIIEHNLSLLKNQDDPTSEYPLDFTNPADVKKLDGSVGEEIDELIMAYNETLDVDDVKK